MSPNFCETALIILFIFHVTQAWVIRLYIDSVDNYLEYSYKNSGQICTSGHFNESLETYEFTHPYRSSLEHENPKDLIRTLLEKGIWNVLAVNWSKEANSYLIGFDYVVFAKQVATELALALSYMPCFRPEVSHFIGNSLGAQINGIAGRSYRELTGQLIGEMVALDPAKVLYEDPNFFVGVNTDSARRVQQISTDIYKYGISEPRGHINFFPNCDKYDEDRHQPECPPNFPPPIYTLTNDDICSHVLALLLYTYSIKYPNELVATKYNTCKGWVAAQGAQNQITFMGFLVNKESFGNYYLTTNGKFPYGKGLPGLVPATTIQ